MNWLTLIVFVALHTQVLAAGHGKYDEREALKYVRYAQAAFCNQRAIESWTCGSICEGASTLARRVKFIQPGPQSGVQGYVAAISETHCVVAFRGSVSRANWATDAMFWLIDWPPESSNRAHAPWCKGCQVHSGFAMAYEELRDAMKAALLELKCRQVSVTGHSLGAAVATLSSLDLRASLGYHVSAVWTFGKPRIGNMEYVESYMKAAEVQGVYPPLWRVVHYHDPVPRLPPDKPFQTKVVHESLEVYYTDKDSSHYIECPQQGAEENHSSSCSWGTSLVWCINLDHITYLNETFVHRSFPSACIGDGEQHSKLQTQIVIRTAWNRANCTGAHRRRTQGKTCT